MSKRKRDEKIAMYKEKLRKLEEQRQKPPRRRILYSSESSDSSDSEEIQRDGTSDKSAAGNESSQQVTTDKADAEPELDPDILEALGAKTGESPEYGDKIHENLAQLWSPLLKKGMLKEDKEKILKEYLVPQNCSLLQAPKLNPEIAAALTDAGRNRDKKLTSLQQQLGAGVTAVSRGMDILVNKGDTRKAIKHLSDACRILSDLHFCETRSRIKLISPTLDKNFLNIIQDCYRDETLFGSKLSEKIKASKAIEKQGSQIKKPPPPVTAPSTSNSRPSHSRGNWTAPPRQNTGKSGRGGNRRLLSYTRKPTTSASSTKQPAKPTTRAQTQH